MVRYCTVPLIDKEGFTRRTESPSAGENGQSKADDVCASTARSSQNTNTRMLIRDNIVTNSRLLPTLHMNLVYWAGLCHYGTFQTATPPLIQNEASFSKLDGYVVCFVHEVYSHVTDFFPYSSLMSFPRLLEKVYGHILSCALSLHSLTPPCFPIRSFVHSGLSATRVVQRPQSTCSMVPAYS